MLNSCFYIFANEIIFLSSIKSIISTVETDKNRQICRFLTEKQIRMRGYDMVRLWLIYWLNNTAVMGKNPRLSILAKIYLAIPALYMYVPSERVFSLAGHLMNKKRARLSPSNIGNIILWIKTWNTTGNNTDKGTLYECGWQCSVIYGLFNQIYLCLMLFVICWIFPRIC